MTRAPVDVVVPFRGDAAQLRAVRERLATLRLAGWRHADRGREPGPDVLCGPQPRRGERLAPWIVFLDADVDPSPGLLDAYFDPPPAERVAILAGGIVDQPAGPATRRPCATRRCGGSMSHDTVLADERFRFAQTANCAIRRAAFGRPAASCRACGRAATPTSPSGSRPRAGTSSRGRTPPSSTSTARRPALLRQRARHGSGAAWLGRRHPGALPARNKLGLVRWSLARWARRGDDPRRDERLEAAIDPLAVWAFELGRLVPNQRR